MSYNAHFLIALTAFCICPIFFNCKVSALATMAVDMGTEFMKVAIVKAGVPMEIALNPESQRKSPCIVSFYKGERLIGSPAQPLATKYPAAVIAEIPLLIGRSLEHPAVKDYQRRYPYHKLSFDENIGQLQFELKDKKYTVEELYAMLLEYARDVAQDFAGTSMKATVITVPYHYGQAERQAVMRAAKLIDLDVLQLINTNSAVALNFGVFHRKAFNKTAVSYMFFDMGSLGTTVTIASYHVGKHRDGDTVLENPILTILGVGSDPLLGTSAFIERMRNHLAKAFNKNKKIAKSDVTKNNRAMSKLTKEAARVVKVLSANQDTYAQIEGLLEEEDFKHQVTRSEFEEMCDDLFQRIKAPIQEAVEVAQLALPNIKEVLLMGGGSRIPKVQELLSKYTDRPDLGKSINTDEAAALGAVYQAAHHSPGFRVLRFVVRDANPYAIAVDFPRVSNTSDSPTEFVRRILFTQGNPYPQKRAITFNKQSKDSTFYVSYADIRPSMQQYIGTKLNITTITTTSVKKQIERRINELKEAGEGDPEIRGVKAHFNLDYSGILTLTSIDAIIQPKKVENNDSKISSDDDKEDGSKSAFEKLGNKISGFFGNKEEPSKEEDSKKIDETVKEKAEEKLNATEKLDVNKKVDTNKSSDPIVDKVLFDTVTIGYAEPPALQMDASMEKLKNLRAADRAKLELERSRNELEAYVFESQDRLTDEKFVKFSSEDERKAIKELASKLSEWYEEQGSETIAQTYDERRNELVMLVDPIRSRIRESEERPAALNELRISLNQTQLLLNSIDPLIEKTRGMMETAQKLIKKTKGTKEKKVESEVKEEGKEDGTQETPELKEDSKTKEETTKDKTDLDDSAVKVPEYIHPEDRAAIEKIVNETRDWLTTFESKLQSMSLTDTAPQTVADIRAKTTSLMTEAKFLAGRFTHWRQENSKLETEIRTAELLSKYEKEKNTESSEKTADNLKTLEKDSSTEKEESKKRETEKPDKKSEGHLSGEL